MSANFLMGFLFIFILGHLFANLMGGSYVSAGDTSAVNVLSQFGVNQVLQGGVFGIPSGAVAFFTQGLPTLLSWDYPMFDGDWQLVRVILVGLQGIAIAWGIIQIFGGTGASIIGGIFGRG